MDRVHRLGQQRAVSVFRLIATDTIEERIMRYVKSMDGDMEYVGHGTLLLCNGIGL